MTHIMYYIIMTSCISSGKWIVPVITGTRPPPTVYYTMNTLPDNGGVIFGGTTINETVYIVWMICLSLLIHTISIQ